MQIDYEHELNPDQLRAVQTTEGPVLILAVAGAGKTRTLVYRVAYLIENGVMPESILLLTFTNKAAREMKTRASKMLDERCSKIEASTYHSFCTKELRHYADRIGIDRGFTILSGSDQTDALNIVKDILHIDARGFPRVSMIAGLISASINRNIPIDELIMSKAYTKLQPWKHEVLRIAKEYAQYKQSHNMLDFDDMLVKFLELLRTCPDVRALLDRKYHYIMVDEYQDSNHLQDEILMEMRRDNNNLAVVGDDMQSLYGFRGADVGNILTFPDRMPGCQTITLTTNYRSNQEILDLSNCVVKNNATEGIVKNMVGTYHAGYKPCIISTDDTNTESWWVCRRIKELLRSGFNGKPVKGSDIAVLERTSGSSASLEISLTRERIPFVKFGGLKFLERAYVKDVMALWKVLVNPKDEISWYRVLQLFTGISTRYAHQLSRLAGEKGEELLVDNPLGNHKFAKSLREFRLKYSEWKNVPFPDIIKNTIDFYRDIKFREIDNMKKANDDKEMLKAVLKDDIGTLSVFSDLASDYRSLSSFLENLSLEPPEGINKSEDSITISTIHSAKGLEFPIVFILDCADGLFPRGNKRGTPSDNEELRCMYVAMTRAEKMLYILSPGEGTVFGKYAVFEHSHFLEGTDKLVEHQNISTHTKLAEKPKKMLTKFKQPSH